MKNLIQKQMRNLLPSVIVTSAIALSLTACQDEDQGFSLERIKQIEYAKNFEKEFGTPDPNHDFSMATLIHANVNLPEIKGTAKMNICTGDPRLSSTRLLGQIMLKDGQGQLDFDAIKGSENVFVTVEQDSKYRVFSVYPISDGQLNIGQISVDFLNATRTLQHPTEFSKNTPTVIKDKKEDLFTGIQSNVQKYKWNDEYYTLAELKAWATAEAEAGRVTLTNFETTTPFNGDCNVGGTYNFTGATLSLSVTVVPSEGGYIFNGRFYTIADLRQWAKDEAEAGRVTKDNYGSTPFNSDCVKSAGYDFTNAQINTDKTTVITVDNSGYSFNDNRSAEKGQKTLKTLDELKEWSKTNETYLNQNNFYSDVFENSSLSWDAEHSCIDYSKAQPNANVKVYKVGDYVYDGQVYTWQGLIDTYNGKSYNDANGPLTNCWFDARLDFDHATVDNTKASPVEAGKYIYNNTVFDNEAALQQYTIGHDLSNSGPYINCFSGGHLDFSNASVNTSKAPFEYITFDIDLTYLDNVETVSAEPWTRGWGYTLFGPKAFFQEQQYYYGKNGKTEDKYNTHYGTTEEEKLAMLAKIESGFKIKTEGGPIELPFIYGATQKIDQFGYVFYADGEDPLTKPHYVLMEDGRPDVNIYQDEWKSGNTGGFSGTSISTWVEGLKSYVDSKDDDVCKCTPGIGPWSQPYGTGTSNPHADWCKSKDGDACNCYMITNYEGTGIYSSAGTHVPGCSQHMTEYLDNYNQQVYGTTYRLVYFDDKGNATYNIPANLNVVFFICPVPKVEDLTSRNDYETNNFMYSLPELNKRINHKYFNTESPSYKNGTQTSESGAVKACAWVHDGKTFLGFEDGGNDEDLNDIIFMVSGNFSTNEIVKLHPIKWHTNVNGVHDEGDTDLFCIMNKKLGDAYSQPSGEPKNGDMVFLGWSTTPDNSSNDCNKTVSGTTPDGGKCYYAIWGLPETPGDYTIKWHKNYDQKHDTSDEDLHASQNVNSGAKYSKPATNPTAPSGKVFVGWSKDPKASPSDVIREADLINITATGDECYFAIYEDAPTPGNDPEPISWIFACEDLGGSFDYDFNDVVWEVKRVAGTTKVSARILAAGGTLPFTLKFNGQKVMTKKEACGSDNEVCIGPLNCDWINFNNVSKEWNLSDNNQEFTVEVEGNSGTTYISASSHKDDNGIGNSYITSPQVLILPHEWCWPKEGIKISNAYTNFVTWIIDFKTPQPWSEWSNHRVQDNTVSRN